MLLYTGKVYNILTIFDWETNQRFRSVLEGQKKTQHFFCPATILHRASGSSMEVSTLILSKQYKAERELSGSGYTHSCNKEEKTHISQTLLSKILLCNYQKMSMCQTHYNICSISNALGLSDAALTLVHCLV